MGVSIQAVLVCWILRDLENKICMEYDVNTSILSRTVWQNHDKAISYIETISEISWYYSLLVAS